MSKTESDPTPRTAQETAQRVLALLTVIGKVHDPEKSLAWMKRHNLEQHLSPAELAFVNEESPPEEARVAFSWRAEAMVPLLWALGGLPELPPFNEQFRVFGVEMVKAALKDPAGFVDQARLRNAEDINSMEDHLYHQHWRVRDRDLGHNVGKRLEPHPGDPPIEELNSGIVYERRYGLSWLAGWGKDWDDVSTDT